MLLIIIAALTIGLLLGLMGSGGSILTVPMLAYGLGHDGKVAIAESLAIVGGIAAATLLPYARLKLVNWRSVLYFGVPGMAGTYLGAWLSRYVAGGAQLTLFAVVMLAAAVLMFRNKTGRTNPAPPPGTAAETTRQPVSYPAPEFGSILALEGVIVGIVTGLVGVGGGFLIVPAMIVFAKLPMRVAIGTSLAVIAMNSFSGLYKYLGVLESLGASIDWSTVALFVPIGILGSLAGHAIATRLNQAVLRKAFAVFLMGMGLFVLGKEVPALLARHRHDAARSTHSGQPPQDQTTQQELTCGFAGSKPLNHPQGSRRET